MKRVLVVVFCWVVTSQVANAATITLNVGAGGAAGDHILGEVFVPNDIPGGLLTRDETAIDALRLMALGARTGTDPEYYRSTTNFGVLPDATQTGALSGTPGNFTFSGDGNSVLIALTQSFTYLMASYDGKSGGAEVWYIGDILAGNTLQFTAFAEPSGTPRDLLASTRYGITSWTLFNPVPDGGATAVLLGLSVLGLGYARRRISNIF